ncbi:carboxypeptidase-like regulatory domain-containing protein [Blastopirellula sp. JC732]|uniref:Carboxypeptidase-like regulatory domain-containing protein n=1 Tax=Blastopirellula sediminis TaxID=2894196 RepID=A0A9X1MSC0_9BACT|nr:carboxypeptidase-like regulatory domain-containing protein [Blastopirellula sediminis]MCC9605110.1 carboxypeptidase-like regulatory domain-containing protein [Blastopirellula sediminis]MCC9631590.1 carboxypeptidase-like regulatory domain-containing protein [Blastopirellula sediminis]
MSNFFPHWKSLSLLAALALSLGCSATKFVPTEYVEGLVTLDGVPIADATVTFQPLEPGQGCAGVGVSDSSGVYRLTTLSNIDGLKPKHGAGVLPGAYQVAVEKVELAPEVQAKIDAGESVAYSEAALKRIFPKRFADPEKSGLVVDVVPGNNDIPLVISSK